MKRETKRKIQWISIVLFVIYLILMTYFLFFAESLGRDFSEREYAYNVHFFKEISRFWEYRSLLGTEAVILNLLGNIVCFIPFGAILPILSQKARNCIIILMCCFWFSFLVECVQLVSKTGCFDVDDLFLNTIGGMIGYMIFIICNILRRKHYG